MKELIEAFDNQEIIQRDGKRYMLTPLTDHSKPTHPLALRQAVNAVCDVANWNSDTPVNKIVSEEERGGFIGVCVALQRDLLFSLAKENPVNIPGEVHVKFKMDYSNSMDLYLNGIEKGDRVLIVDDMIATGGTVVAMIHAMREVGAEINDIVAVSEKIDLGGVDKIFKETGIKPKTIVRIDTSGKKSKVVSTIFDDK